MSHDFTSDRSRRPPENVYCLSSLIPKVNNVAITKQPKAKKTFERTKIFRQIIFFTYQIIVKVSKRELWKFGEVVRPSAESFKIWEIPLTCPPVALCGLRQNPPVSSASLPLLSGINQAIRLSAFLSRFRLIVYLANNFSIHQPSISRNLQCMLFFHAKPPCSIECNAVRFDFVSQFRHQISKMRELGNGLFSS